MTGFRVDARDHLKRLSEIQQKQLYAIQTYAQVAGNKMVSHAKGNVPWTNRTRTARNTITAVVAQGTVHQIIPTRKDGKLAPKTITRTIGPNNVAVGLQISIDYGFYLEFRRFRHKGNLSICFPTVRKMSPEILKAWADRMKSV